MEKAIHLSIALFFVFLCGVIIGENNFTTNPKVKLVQMTIKNNEFNERVVEKYHGKEVCALAAELKNKKRKEDESIYYCAE